ncbi:hypothetical protein KR222_009504 [Zaprionus bogoriensis]|nr:hypothetical protein KR222_009504 [Zaprionus bogoriensis]
MLKFSLQIALLSRPGNCSSGTNRCVGSTRSFKVAVVGAAGGVGQPLSLLLKQLPQVTKLALHDVVATKGIAADLSHICTSAAVESYEGSHNLERALSGSSIVVMSSSVPPLPETNADLELMANAKMIIDVTRAVSISCPDALLAVITSPLNIIVPIVARVLRDEDAYDPKRLFGVTTLNVIRAKTFLGDSIGVDPMEVSVPVVGGHSPGTFLTLTSQTSPAFAGSVGERAELVDCIRKAEDEVVQAKGGKGSSTLAMAYAVTHFVNALLRALNGEKDIIECAYVQSDITEAKFFASPVELGPNGIKNYLEIPSLDDDEEKALKNMVVKLKKDIQTGCRFPLV